jgi:hypothetical protein
LLFQSPAKGRHSFITIAVAGDFPVKADPIGCDMDMLLFGVFVQDAYILVIGDAELFGCFPAYFY